MIGLLKAVKTKANTLIEKHKGEFTKQLHFYIRRLIH